MGSFEISIGIFGGYWEIIEAFQGSALPLAQFTPARSRYLGWGSSLRFIILLVPHDSVNTLIVPLDC